jgi:hypothetical protein
MNEFLMDLDEKFVPRTEYQKESDWIKERLKKIERILWSLFLFLTWGVWTAIFNIIFK